MVTFREKYLCKMIRIELMHDEGCMDKEVMLQIMQEQGIPVRNVCCRMNAVDKARLDAVVAHADMSVQEFVTEAIYQAINEALSVIKERGASKSFDEAFERNLHAESLRLVPRADDPDQFSIQFVPGEQKEGE